MLPFIFCGHYCKCLDWSKKVHYVALLTAWSWNSIYVLICWVQTPCFCPFSNHVHKAGWGTTHKLSIAQAALDKTVKNENLLHAHTDTESRFSTAQWLSELCDLTMPSNPTLMEVMRGIENNSLTAPTKYVCCLRDGCHVKNYLYQNPTHDMHMRHSKLDSIG